VMAAEQAQMDVTFHFIMKHFVDKGQTPHYTEVAKALGAPFNNLPTQARITIDGEQKWFGR